MLNLGSGDKIYKNIVDSLISIREARVAILFREKENAYISASLRSNSQINVAKLASYFGGGGHVRAAGFRIKGKIKKINNQYHFDFK